jgi:hypothetical protein
MERKGRTTVRGVARAGGFVRYAHDTPLASSSGRLALGVLLCRVGDCEVGMGFGLPEKAAAFCRELGDASFLELARQNGLEHVMGRARAALESGRIDATLESDLDALDAALRQVDGEGLYQVAVVRGYAPWPGTAGGTGAQWWACPTQRCAGRGRVKPGQQPPVCAAAGAPLEARPLQE